MSQENPSVRSHESLSVAPESRRTAESSGLNPSSTLPTENEDHQKAGQLAQAIQDSPSQKAPDISPTATAEIESRETYIKKAEEIIQQDQGDPAQEEKDYEAIQERYLKDIYDKDITKSGEDLGQK